MAFLVEQVTHSNFGADEEGPAGNHACPAMVHEGSCKRIGLATAVVCQTILSRDAVGQQRAGFSGDETDVQTVEESMGLVGRLLFCRLQILRSKRCTRAGQRSQNRRQPSEGSDRDRVHLITSLSRYR